MAATLQTPEQLREIARRFSTLGTQMRAIAAAVENAGMDEVWLQVEGVNNTFLPKLEGWLVKQEANAKLEVAAFVAGRPSPMEHNRSRGAKQRATVKKKSGRRK